MRWSVQRSNASGAPQTVPVAATHDLEFPGTGSGDDRLHLAPLVARIRDDALQKRKAPARLPQQSFCAIPVLDAGRMNADRQQQAQRVGQEVALAAKDLLARIIPRRVERGPPLTAPLALWLSIAPAVGLASRPASRAARHRARDGCGSACRPSPTGPG